MFFDQIPEISTAIEGFKIHVTDGRGKRWVVHKNQGRGFRPFLKFPAQPIQPARSQPAARQTAVRVRAKVFCVIGQTRSLNSAAAIVSGTAPAIIRIRASSDQRSLCSLTNYQRFKHLFYSKHEKKPKPIKGLAYESLRLVQNPGKKTDHVHKRSEN